MADAQHSPHSVQYIYVVPLQFSCTTERRGTDRRAAVKHRTQNEERRLELETDANAQELPQFLQSPKRSEAVPAATTSDEKAWFNGARVFETLVQPCDMGRSSSNGLEINYPERIGS